MALSESQRQIVAEILHTRLQDQVRNGDWTAIVDLLNPRRVRSALTQELDQRRAGLIAARARTDSPSQQARIDAEVADIDGIVDDDAQ